MNIVKLKGFGKIEVRSIEQENRGIEVSDCPHLNGAFQL